MEQEEDNFDDRTARAALPPKTGDHAPAAETVRGPSSYVYLRGLKTKQGGPSHGDHRLEDADRPAGDPQ
jgi:hypothetical protein